MIGSEMRRTFSVSGPFSGAAEPGSDCTTQAAGGEVSALESLRLPNLSIAECDPPYHDDLRRALNPMFNRPASEKLRAIEHPVEGHEGGTRKPASDNGAGGPKPTEQWRHVRQAYDRQADHDSGPRASI